MHRSLTAEQRFLLEKYASTVKASARSAYSTSDGGYSGGAAATSASSADKTKETPSASSSSTTASSSSPGSSPSSSSAADEGGPSLGQKLAGKAFGWLADRLEGKTGDKK